MHLIDASDKRNMLYVSQEVFDCMQRIPPIDPESLRPQGEWRLFKDEGFFIAECSNCGMIAGATQAAWWDYCPNCGAYMEGAGENA